VKRGYSAVDGDEEHHERQQLRVEGFVEDDAAAGVDEVVQVAVFVDVDDFLLSVVRGLQYQFVRVRDSPAFVDLVTDGYQ